jgi:hypothetical protein
MCRKRERGDLPKALSGLVRPAGIEPATPAFGEQYSIEKYLRLAKQAMRLLRDLVGCIAPNSHQIA